MLEQTTLTLAANVENTYNFTGADPNVITLINENEHATPIYVLLDQTVAVADADAYVLNQHGKLKIICDGCTVIHVKSAVIGTVTINVERRFIPLKILTLVGDTEQVVTFGGQVRKISLTNRSTSLDAYFAFDKDAAKGTGVEELLAAGTSVELDEINFKALHVISAGTPVVEVRVWEEKNG